MTITHARLHSYRDRLSTTAAFKTVVFAALAWTACYASQAWATSPAIQGLSRLADQYVANQLPSGAWTPNWTPEGAAIDEYMISLTSIEMYKAYAATGNQNYKTYADQAFAYYCQENTIVTAALAAIQLDNWAYFKRYNPQSTQYDAQMATTYDELMGYRWDKGSYFRCGYLGTDGLDVGFTCDLALIGRGLLGYYRTTGNGATLQAAQGLAPFFVTEMTPSVFDGAWSTTLGSWAVGCTSNTFWEHHPNTPASSVAWGVGAQNAIQYLTELYPLIDDTALKQEIKEKCVASMKWQFDNCQFPDGAVGMCAQDDKWGGMAAAAVQTFLWNRDTEFLSPAEIQEYTPKAQAAADWLLSLVATDLLAVDTAACGGYFQVTGLTENTTSFDLANSRVYLSSAFDALSRYDDITPAPEPSALMLMAVGLVGLLGYVWRYGK